MENYDNDVIMQISTFLPPNVRNVLSLTSSSYNTALKQLESNQLYWLKKVEAVLNVTIPEEMYRRPHDWKTAYRDILATARRLFFSDDDDFFKLAILAGVDPSYHNNIIIQNACLDGNVKAVKRLLKDPRVDPTANHNNAIILAIIEGHVEVLDILLEDGRCDPNDASEELPLTVAIDNKQVDCAIRLLQDDRVLENEPAIVSNLDYAIRKSLTRLVDYIIEEVGLSYHVNTTALLITAARSGNSNAVKLLLMHPNTDPTYHDNYAIMIAHKNNNLSVVAELLGVRAVRQSLPRDELRVYVDYVRKNT